MAGPSSWRVSQIHTFCLIPLCMWLPLPHPLAVRQRVAGQGVPCSLDMPASGRDPLDEILSASLVTPSASPVTPSASRVTPSASPVTPSYMTLSLLPCCVVGAQVQQGGEGVDAAFTDMRARVERRLAALSGAMSGALGGCFSLLDRLTEVESMVRAHAGGCVCEMGGDWWRRAASHCWTG
eukprot:353366-Chlamydomonas_euryale.AAC.2